MLYCVNKYQDIYKAMEELPPQATVWDRGLCFPTENEAKGFIRDRAFRAVQSAEKELKRQKERLKRCEKEYPISFDIGGEDGR